PVMVGHFNNDGVHSAEKALNRCLGGRLMQRYDMGYYPGKIGESEVFFNLNTNPRGAIVCGLGNTQELTHYLLAKTTEMATLKYAMFMRDNYTLARAKSFAEGISFIFIGTGYGRLQVEDSLKGILLGVSNANAYIRQHQDGLMPITEIELINHYESLSSQAYWGLSRLQHADNRFSFELVKGVKSKEGAKKKRAFISDRDDWWHQFNIESLLTKECIKGFAFNSSSGLARIEEEEVHNGLDQVEVLLERMSHSAAWDKRLSKALFELLIPNRFKDIIRNQNNILLKLDLEAAQFPWEMFHDFDSDETPAAVNSGLIRQLLTSEYESLPLRAASNSALIIGDPLYNEENLPQLPAAKKEAQDVNAKLEQAAFETFSLINAEPAEIMLELYTRPYKILHFAGHGLYDLANERVGIAIGDGICINPAMIKQLSYVPEFVFINCCYSGTLDAKDSAYTQSRFKLAANVGTQLINMGVKAIVITGWAVDDAAAATFSEHFYKRMLMGYEFGEAVQMARKMCYQNHGHTNTWGAYQCYGNQHYKFFDLSKAQDDDYDYVLSSQVYIDLENLYSEVKHNATKKKQCQKRLETILNNAASNN
ncbi:MAG: CHAT domain-containing protein, partial [Bacteroidota bacterium]|nr:CHAT domain-containing protein [Bacteroidota bacterium]